MELSKERQKSYVLRYLSSDCYSVSQFYKSGGSAEKLRAERLIKDYMQKVGGYGYKILGGNAFHYTAGWLLEKGDRTLLYIETHCHTYEIDMYNL